MSAQNVRYDLESLQEGDVVPGLADREVLVLARDEPEGTRFSEVVISLCLQVKCKMLEREGQREREGERGKERERGREREREGESISNHRHKDILASSTFDPTSTFHATRVSTSHRPPAHRNILFRGPHPLAQSPGLQG